MRTTTEAERHQARREGCGWLTTTDAAEQLGGCSRAHVRRLVALGHLQAFDASLPGSGRADWRFRQEWLDAYKATAMQARRPA